MLGKFRRLIVPWAIAVLTLIPLYKVIFLYSRGLPQEHWTTYFHVTNPNSQNWLWFLPVLFCFDMLYLLTTKSGVRAPKISLWTAVLGALLAGFVYSFFIGGFLGFRSWTLTPLIDFENERLLVYFLCFRLGVLFYRQGIFAEKPKGKLLCNIANGTAWVPVTAHIFIRLIPFFSAEGFSVTPAYRLMWWVSWLCLGSGSLALLLFGSFVIWLFRFSGERERRSDPINHSTTEASRCRLQWLKLCLIRPAGRRVQKRFGQSLPVPAA